MLLELTSLKQVAARTEKELGQAQHTILKISIVRNVSDDPYQLDFIVVHTKIEKQSKEDVCFFSSPKGATAS